MGKQAEPFLLAHLDGINKQDFHQREIQLEEHVQHTTPYQNPNNVRMKKTQRDLCEMKKLLEKRKNKQMEPNDELFLSKIHHVAGKVSKGYSLAICWLDRDIVQNMKTSLNFPFGQDTNWTLRFEAPDSSVFSFTLLRPSTGRSNSSFYHYAKWIWAMWKPARDNAIIKTNHPGHLSFIIASTIQKGAQTNQKPETRQIWLLKLTKQVSQPMKPMKEEESLSSPQRDDNKTHELTTKMQMP